MLRLLAVIVVVVACAMSVLFTHICLTADGVGRVDRQPPSMVLCPACGDMAGLIRLDGYGIYNCEKCEKEFAADKNTVPLTKWRNGLEEPSYAVPPSQDDGSLDVPEHAEDKPRVDADAP